MTARQSVENDVAACPHPRLALIYAEPNGRWECEACGEVLAMREVFAVPTTFDLSRMHHGICPKCREDKFIGHGPLCVDCFTGTPIPPATTEGGGA